MSKKFNKNREVDSLYFNVPIKYILNYNGKNTSGYNKYREETYEEWKKRQEEWIIKNPIFKDFLNINLKTYNSWKKEGLLEKKLTKKGVDKTLCIIDFYGKNKALVGWRNNTTCKMGMTHICNVFTKNNKVYLKYKDKDILISNNSGWVL